MSKSYGKLKDLYTRLLDSRDGYEQALKEAGGGNFKPLLAELKDERAAFAEAVRADLEKFGENVEEEGSILAGLHRSFLSVRDAVTGNDDDAIKAEIVRGEQQLKDAYDEAVAEADDAITEAELTQQRRKVDEAIARVDTRKAA